MPKFKPAIDEEWLSITKLNKPLALGDQLPFYIYPLKSPVELESELNWLDYKELSDEKWLWNDVEKEIEKNFEEKTYIDTVIDLTGVQYTETKYYDPRKLKNYHKIQTRGGGQIPPGHLLARFNRILNRLCDEVDRNRVETDGWPSVAVHCTHGLNRTGFFIANYLVHELGYSGPEALEIFETARGKRMKHEVHRNWFLYEEWRNRSQSTKKFDNTPSWWDPSKNRKSYTSKNVDKSWGSYKEDKRLHDQFNKRSRTPPSEKPETKPDYNQKAFNDLFSKSSDSVSRADSFFKSLNH